MSSQRVRARREATCAAHAGGAQVTAPGASLDVAFESLADAQRAGFAIVDVRDARERDTEPLAVPSIHLPMNRLLTGASSLDLGVNYLLVCATGKRSAAAADLLRSQGVRECRSLRGGLALLKTSA
jgi:adenylyltransferase/sulfurtransferase